ncbi:MAG: HlyC/CorC family transporter [Chloroflexi bacterium]|nr:HlyC/CorC family transporter [Chloroflexota bacterium]
MTLLFDFLLIALLIALNAFFVTMEFAAVVSRKPRLMALAEKGHRGAQIVLSWIENPQGRDRLVAAAQLGITIVSLALGAVGESTFEALLHHALGDAQPPEWLGFLQTIMPALPLVLSLVIVTTLHVVLGEQVPKVAALRNPEATAAAFAPIMQIFIVTFKWFIDLLDWITRAILALFGLEAQAHSSLSVEELKLLVRESEAEGVLPEEEGEIIHAVLDFSQVLVRQVMVPRTDIIAAPADAPLAEVVRLAAKHGVTKIPLYEGDLDHIVGIVYLKSILPRLAEGKINGTPAREVADEALFVPESLPIRELLRLFREKRQHIAIVVDEYGGTAGLVTLEDVLEELVGEVGDPFDRDAPDVVPQPDGSWLVDGMALMDDVNEALGTDLHDPHYDTVAGFVLGRLGRIPKEGDQVTWNGVRLTVERMDGLRIDRLRLEKTPPASTE